MTDRDWKMLVARDHTNRGVWLGYADWLQDEQGDEELADAIREVRTVGLLPRKNDSNSFLPNQHSWDWWLSHNRKHRLGAIDIDLLPNCLHPDLFQLLKGKPWGKTCVCKEYKTPEDALWDLWRAVVEYNKVTENAITQ